MSARSSINNYKQTVMNVTTDLHSLRDMCVELKLDPSVEGIDKVLQRLSEDMFNVAIVGEFKRGKSTLINALLEQSILPADVLPCSATLNRVTYGIDPHATIEYRDGRTQDVPVEELEDYVTKLTPESEQRAANVKSATVYYPISFCKNGVTIIDTPGLNDDAAMTEVTLSVLPEADAAIMVMMCGSPFSESEREFLEQKIMASDLGRVMFVVTGIDRYDEEEQEKLLELFRRRITESVLNKARSVYGEDSPEFQTYQRKLGSIKIFPVSARNALRAKMRGDEAMLQESLFPQFEEGLMDFLARDRGALQLSAPVSRAKNSSAEILRAIELRTATIGMDQEEFDAKYAEAMQRMEEIRAERAEEMQRISAAADAAYEELTPQIDGFWKSLEVAADGAVDAYPINSVKEMKSESTQEGLGKAVANAMQNESQLFAERVQHALSSAVADEAERLGGFEESFLNCIGGIQDSFTSADKDKVDGAAIATMAGSVLTAGIGMFGSAIGTAYSGYQAAGWKGALLGGGVGFVATTGTLIGSVSLAIAIGLGSMPVLPLILLSGAVGTKLSRSAVNAVFKSPQIGKFKAQYKEAVHGQIEQMRAENDYTAQIRNQVNDTFDALKLSVVSETETVLENTQNQLDELRMELASTQATREHESKRLAEFAEKTAAILDRSDALESDLTRVLSN